MQMNPNESAGGTKKHRSPIRTVLMMDYQLSQGVMVNCALKKPVNIL